MLGFVANLTLPVLGDFAGVHLVDVVDEGVVGHDDGAAHRHLRQRVGRVVVSRS